MIKWGLISKMDSEILMRTLDMVMQDNSQRILYTTCVGVFDGDTDRAINKYIINKGLANKHIAIDNNKDKKVLNPFAECNLIIGNSNEVYNQLPDNSQHFIFQDACHCFSCCVSSFFCYAGKVKVGGYMAWHDTGKHILPFKDFQHGDKENPDAYISVRKALNSIGLLEMWEFEYGGTNVVTNFPGWELIGDIADENNEAGGICVFKKLY